MGCQDQDKIPFYWINFNSQVSICLDYCNQCL